MKRLLILIISFALALTFTACKDNNKPNDNETTNPESVEFTITETTVAPGSYTMTAKVLPKEASQELSYTIIGSVPGVSIEGAVVTVSENAVDGTKFKVKASVKTDPTISASIELTVNNPAPNAVLISTEAELRAMDLAGSYKLANDITLTSPWTPIGTPDNSDTGAAGVGFSGTLDGNGYKIKNLVIAGTWNAGFFAQIDETGVVKNLGFVNEIEEGVTGNAWCGVVAGINHGLIENCYTNVRVTMAGCPGGAFTGSNVGINAIIRKCYAIGAVVVGEGNHGACFSGSNDGGEIVNSYFLETSGNCAIGWNKGQDANIQKSKTWMTTASNYVNAGWDSEVWALVDGYFPMLKYEGFVAPSPILPDPELSITNETKYLDYNVEEERTLQITYSICNVTDSSVTFSLSEAVAGVSITDTGFVILSDEVVDGASFTVVVTSNEFTTLSETITITVNRAVVVDAIEITSIDDLIALTTTENPADMAKSYILKSDIDASGVWFNTPIGAAAGVPFTGSFDGNGYTIIGLAGGNEGNDYGLFREIGVGGVVKNLGIAIREGRNLCANRMGAVASVNKGTISNILITGEIWCTDVNAGGVVWDNHGVIENVVMFAIINHYYTEANGVGAITYHQQEGAIIRNCFVDKDTTKLTSVTRLANEDLDVACVTTQNMKSAATFANFDTKVWNISEGSYPSLKKGSSVESSIEITSIDDLIALTTTENPADMAKSYILKCDIDASGVWFNTPIGAGAGVPFTGTFDGNGYTIVGLAGGNEGNDYGLFKEIGVDGVVKNLGIAIREGRNLCANRMGAVASVNKGTISNILITGEIWCTDVNAGGVVWDNHGVIENVVMLAIINHYYTEVNGVGAITYHQQEGAIIRNCFVDKDTTKLTSVTRLANEDLDVACVTTQNMKSAATFANFDTKVWNISEGSYPSLKKGIR